MTHYLDTEYNSIHEYNKKSIDSDIKIIYLNARSIRNKLDDIEDLLINIKPAHILIVSATWLNDAEEKFYNINGY